MKKRSASAPTAPILTIDLLLVWLPIAKLVMLIRSTITNHHPSTGELH